MHNRADKTTRAVWVFHGIGITNAYFAAIWAHQSRQNANVGGFASAICT
jgi:hypothetical protein